MKRVIGAIVLALSACGYPLTQLAVRRWGVRGAAMAECVCAGLAIRDASMVAGRVPGRLRTVPAALLFLKLGAGVVASLAGLPPLLSAQSADRAAAEPVKLNETSGGWIYPTGLLGLDGGAGLVDPHLGWQGRG